MICQLDHNDVCYKHIAIKAFTAKPQGIQGLIHSVILNKVTAGVPVPFVYFTTW